MTRMLKVIVRLLFLISVTASAAPPPAQRPLLAVRDGRVSARIVGVPLGRVLTELSRQTGAAVRGLGADGERPITVAFTNVPLREALERLVAPASFTMTTGRHGELVRLAILGGGDVVVIDPPPQSLSDSDEAFSEPHIPDEATLIAEARGAARAVDRTEALSLLGQHPSTPTARQAMADVLRDEADPDVRRFAYEQLEQAGEPIPTETIAGVARDDPDSRLRVSALTALAANGHSPEARATIAWAAENDADPAVRQMASGVLTELPRDRQR